MTSPLLQRIIFSFIFFLLFTITACNHAQPKLKPLYADDVILAFGDSLTSGVGATAETSYPSILEKLTGFRVANAGIPGEETSDGLTRIASELELHHPRLVIVLLGGNDLIRKRPHAIIKENLRGIIRAIQQSGAQVVLIAVPVPGMRLKTPAFYQELGMELKIPVEDESLVKLFSDPKYRSDYIHLNQQGYRLFAEDIATFLKNQDAISKINT